MDQFSDSWYCYQFRYCSENNLGLFNNFIFFYLSISFFNDSNPDSAQPPNTASEQQFPYERCATTAEHFFALQGRLLYPLTQQVFPTAQKSRHSSASFTDNETSELPASACLLFYSYARCHSQSSQQTSLKMPALQELCVLTL